MSFDISQLELSDSATFTLKTARGDEDMILDGKPVTVEVFSPGSPEGVKVLHKFGRKAQIRQFRALRGDIKEQDADEADREYAEKLAGFTKGFSDNLPVTPLELYLNPRCVYIAKQVEAFVDKYGNFSKGPSAS